MKPDKAVQRQKELVVKSRTENLSDIRNFIHSAAKSIGFVDEAIDNIILAVDEACTNIIKHAYKFYPDGKIIIRLNYSNKKLTVEIIDYGSSFAPDTIPDPDLQQYFNQKRVGGLGMYLMKSLMDDVKYSSVPGKYNSVSLSKKLNSSG